MFYFTAKTKQTKNKQNLFQEENYKYCCWRETKNINTTVFAWKQRFSVLFIWKQEAVPEFCAETVDGTIVTKD